MNYIKKNATGIAEALISIVLLIGVLTVFKACDAHGEMIMSCHWAHRTVIVSAGVLTLLSLVRIVLPSEGVKKGISIAILPEAVFTLFIPNGIISLCMMSSMSCQALFKPFVTATTVLLAIAALADIIVLSVLSGKKKED